LLLAVTALADQNPQLAIFLDADMDTGNDVVNEVCPNPNETIMVYVCFDQFGGGGGMLGAAFKFDRTFAGFKLAQTNLLGGLDFGDVEVAPGWAITAGANCQFPDANGVVVAASVQYLYLGTPGIVQILAHDVDGHVGADCDNLLDDWCIASLDSHGFAGNFGVCMPPPDGDCVPAVPVEDRSWGTIKALYR
jgi:hypothetical protein